MGGRILPPTPPAHDPQRVESQDSFHSLGAVSARQEHAGKFTELIGTLQIGDERHHSSTLARRTDTGRAPRLDILPGRLVGLFHDEGDLVQEPAAA